MSPVWTGSDAADVPVFIDRLVCRSGNVLDDITTLALYRLGAVQPLILYAQMLLMRALRISHVTEFGWALSTVLLGSMVVYLAFAVGREIAGRLGAIASGLLLATSPMAIMQSRHSGAPWMHEEFFQLLLVLLVLKLARAPSTRMRAGFHAALATYFWTGNQMLGIAPVLAYGLWAACIERPSGESIVRFLWQRFGGPSLLVPTASMGTLLYVTFALHKGHLAHALFDKQHELGFYVGHWFDDMAADAGPGVTWLGIVSVVLSFTADRRLLTTAKLPIVLFLSYASAFWFLIPPGTTLTRAYISYGLNALLLVLGTAPLRTALDRLSQLALPSLAAVIMLVEAGQSVYQLYELKILSVKRYQGSYTENNGVKTAAWWVRTHSPDDRRVFSDASGGMGLEPPNMTLYFRKPHFSMYDAPQLTSPYAKFQGRVDEIDYLVVQPRNRGLVRRYFGESFHESLEIQDGRRGDVLAVFDRDPSRGAPEIIDVSVGDAEFDRRYSMLCSR